MLQNKPELRISPVIRENLGQPLALARSLIHLTTLPNTLSLILSGKLNSMVGCEDDKKRQESGAIRMQLLERGIREGIHAY